VPRNQLKVLWAAQRSPIPGLVTGWDAFQTISDAHHDLMMYSNAKDMPWTVYRSHTTNIRARYLGRLLVRRGKVAQILEGIISNLSKQK